MSYKEEMQKMKKLRKPGSLFRDTCSPVVTMKPLRSSKGPRWLLFFYSVASKPVSNRMKVWRKLMKTGAVNLKGAAYILPFNDEHYEFLQWLLAEITEMKGEAAFITIEKVDSMKDDELTALFDQHRAGDYRPIEKALDDLERKLSSIRKGTTALNMKGLSDQCHKLLKEFEEVRKIDFFSSKEGEALNGRIKHVQDTLRGLSGKDAKKERPEIITCRSTDDYQGKVWETRKKPFIDRMASAWLIRRFIDKAASFRFIDEKDVEDAAAKGFITFDVRGGEFTHRGDMCTFEVLVRSFGLKGKVLKKLADIVHDLDMKDEKYKATEAAGLEDILMGIRKTAKDDREALEKGMQVFEMLYASKS